MSDWPCGISGHILSRSGPSSVGFHRPAPRVHPVDVAAHGVDLAVVGDEPVRVRQLPGREGVGGEALVHQRQRRLRQRVAQVLVEGADLVGQQQALVDHRAASRTTACRSRSGSAGRTCSPAAPAGSGSACGSPGACARRRPGPCSRGAAGDDRLADHRHLVQHRLAQAGRCRSARRASRAAAGPRRRMKCSNWPMAQLAGRARPAAGSTWRRRSRPGGGSSTPAVAAQSRSSASGIWIRQPAPSPTSGSAPTAPRWSRLTRISRPQAMISCDLRPLMLATKPTPHASCS